MEGKGRKKVKKGKKGGEKKKQKKKERNTGKQSVNLLEYSRISRRSWASNTRRKKSGMRGREWDYVDMPGLKEINGIRKFRFYSKYSDIQKAVSK